MDVTIKGQGYRTGRLNAFQQLHVSRRIAPVLAVMGVRGLQLATAPPASEEVVLGRFVELLQPMSEVLSKMSDEDVNYVLHTCLGVCMRHVSDGKYQNVLANGQFMYDDIDMDVMVALAVNVMRDNLQGFLKGLGASTPSPSP